jgi:hypothetical protein
VTFSKTAAAAAVILAVLASPAAAQQGGSPDPATPPDSTSQSTASDDATLQLAQPDFTLIALPTGLRVPVGKAAFRVTHRFRRPLGQGDFSDLASDAFGLDNGSITGLEVRFGIFRGMQAGVHRTGLGKTVEFFGQYDVLRKGPLGVAVWGSVDGTDNFTDSYTPAIGAILSRLFGETAAIYIEPMWVNNSNPLPKDIVDDNDTFVIGLAGRLRVRSDVYLTAEWSPRVSGYDPNVDAVAFAFEKRIGGHMFQINFSNHFATTMGQIARGGFNNDDWYLGFNITRKFF